MIMTGGHLSHNPRVIKEATALVSVGHKVEIVGAWYDATLKDRDKELTISFNLKFTPVLDLTRGGSCSRAQRFWCRARAKLGEIAKGTLGWENLWQFGYFGPAMRRAARRSKPELLIAHLEPPLPATGEALRRGQRIGLDMEDWFSEDLLPEARARRPLRLLRSLEQELLLGAVHTSCPSHAMSNALATEYGCRPPTVVYNAFPWAERLSLDGKFKDRKNPRLLSLHWYSQTLGKGRGLEDLFAALPLVKGELEIHLRGNPVTGFDDWLAARVPEVWRKRIFIHNLVSNQELLSRIAEHDIGFAGEMKYCRSRDLTVTNKILHYLLGGLAVVASDTAGHKEVADKAPGAVLLYPSGERVALAERINTLLSNPHGVSKAKAAALNAAEQAFCWERVTPTLVSSVERALARQSKD